MLFFVIGLITGLIIIPILYSLIDVVYSWIEVLKIKPAKIINEWNQEQTKGEKCESYPIGFQMQAGEDE